MTLPSTPNTSTDATAYPGLAPPPAPRFGPATGSGSGMEPGSARGAGASATDGPGLPDLLQDNPLRDGVVRRLALVGVRHARAIDERRGRDDEPGPHVIAFFYAQPRPGPGQVAVASRAFLRDDVADLATVLRTIGDRAREYPHLDPRRHLAGTSEDMHPDSTYLGVGTSTLLPPIPGSGSYPWHGLACLTDGTHLTVSADAHPLAVGGPGAMRVTTTRTLGRNDSMLAASPYSWTWATTQGHRGSPLAHLLAPLAQLHDYLAATQANPPGARR